MDRVLLLFDELQYASHIEKTLRKMGFDTETITNEYNLNEKILTFNPDVIIVKGGSNSKSSSLLVGKRLKEAIKFNGKVILIFPEDSRPGGADLIKLRMDLLLVEPISALRLTAHILSLLGGNHDSIMDKLLRIAHTDLNFRQNEQIILRQMGESIDTEIQLISTKLLAENSHKEVVIDDNTIQSFIDPQFNHPDKVFDDSSGAGTEKSADFDIDPAYVQKLKDEMRQADVDLALRIESYNQAISGVDQDLKVGINKRQTKKQALELLEVTSAEEKKGRDNERKKFAKALWKK